MLTDLFIIGIFKLLSVEQFVHRVFANCLAENMPFLLFRIKCKDAGSLAYNKLFEKLYESRQTLDALQSVIPISKGELKKRDEENKKKDAELMKLRQVVDKVKRNTEEISELSTELINISLGV